MHTIFLILIILISNVYALETQTLDQLSISDLEAIHLDPFTGSFYNKAHSLRLYTYDTQHYKGEILFKNQLFLLTATKTGNKLTGYIKKSGQRFKFELYFQNQRLIFHSRQGKLSLQSSIPTQRQPYLPLNNQKTKTIPILNQSEKSIDYLVPKINQDLLSFINLLRGWFSTQLSDKTATDLVSQQILPLTILLSYNLAELEKLSKNLQIRALSINQVHQWQSLTKISNHSQLFFQQWQQLLQKMLYLNQQNQQKKLKILANKRLPIAIKNTHVVVQRLHHALLDLQQNMQLIKPIPQQPSITPHHLNPAKMMKMENLKSMTEMMREAMRLFREMFFPSNTE